MKTFPTRIAMLASLPPGIGVEVGVQRGEFSRQILDGTNVRHLTLVDCWKHLGGDYAKDPADIDDGGHEANYRQVCDIMMKHIIAGRATIRRGMSLEIVGQIADGSLDFCYLDAAHDYANVMADLIAWAPKIRAGGVLCGHDFVSNEKSMGMGFAVVEAVTDFCRSHGWKLTAVTEEDWPSFMLERV